MPNSNEEKKIVVQVEGDGNNVSLRDIVLKPEKFSSLMVKISPQLIKLALEVELGHQGNKKEFNFNEKISHNHLKIYKSWVEKYGEYGQLIDSVYESLDDESPLIKARIMIAISQYYTDVKVNIFTENKSKNYSNEIECIRENADEIFSRVIEKIKSEIYSGKVDKEITVEDIQICATVIACHGFMHCKILEPPPKVTI